MATATTATGRRWHDRARARPRCGAVLRRRPGRRVRSGHDRRQPARYRVHAAHGSRRVRPWSTRRRHIAAAAGRPTPRVGRRCARPRLRCRPDRSDDGAPLARRDRVGDRRQRTCPRTVPGERRPRTGSPTSVRSRPTKCPLICSSVRSGRTHRSASERRRSTNSSLRWLPRLEPAGTATLVVQKHLGADSLQRWLTAQGFPTERIGSKAGYRLLSVRR